MSLPEEVQRLIDEEQTILDEVLESLRSQRGYEAERLKTESERSRGLNSDYVAATRVEDKQMLASDEAVSYRLRDLKRDEVTHIDKLLNRPYFARIVLEEEVNGRMQKIEYKLGTVSNVECRIIDWRKAPIARLFYEYREGEEFAELIQGREREGTILVRNKIEIENGKLVSITCAHGTFVCENGSWSSGSSSKRKRRAGELPDILSLITAEQFQAITEDAETAVFLEGVAGSGKTTVALHRLSWLLSRGELAPEDSLVVVRSAALREYVSRSLQSLDVEGVPVTLLSEWLSRCVASIIGCSVDDIPRPIAVAPAGVSRVKHSFAVLELLEEHIHSTPAESIGHGLAGYQKTIVRILSNTHELLERDESKLLDREVILEAQRWTEKCISENLVDDDDDALFAYFHLLTAGTLAGREKLDHIFVDEVQDLTAIELALVVRAAKRRGDVTLAGDTSQRMRGGSAFPIWERLRDHWGWGKEGDEAQLVSLTVSHRSTAQIMRVADHVSGKRRTTGGREGKRPIWYQCLGEQSALAKAIRWLTHVLEKFPDEMICVICRDPQQSRELFSLLQPTFGPQVRLGDRYAFSFDEGVVVTDVTQVKGLEFSSVFIWNPSKRNYPHRDEGRNSLYVAVTRAQDHLAFSGWGRATPHLPYHGRRLIRIEREEEE